MRENYKVASLSSVYVWNKDRSRKNVFFFQHQFVMLTSVIHVTDRLEVLHIYVFKCRYIPTLLFHDLIQLSVYSLIFFIF